MFLIILSPKLKLWSYTSNLSFMFTSRLSTCMGITSGPSASYTSCRLRTHVSIIFDSLTPHKNLNHQPQHYISHINSRKKSHPPWVNAWLQWQSDPYMQVQSTHAWQVYYITSCRLASIKDPAGYLFHDKTFKASLWTELILLSPTNTHINAHTHMYTCVFEILWSKRSP